MSFDIRLRADSSQAEREIRDFARKAGVNVKNLESRSARSSAGMVASFKRAASFLAPFGIALGAREAVRAIGGLITEASDLQESINAVNVVFGEGSDVIHQFGQNTAQSVGLARSEFNQLATVSGALLKDVGLNMDEVAELTNLMVRRASDLASVFQSDVSDALTAFNAAIRGETEPIRRYTGDVTDATLENFALSQGITKSIKSMSEQEKRLLRLRTIIAQTNVVEGDFANTSNDLANSQRQIESALKDVQAELGNKLLVPVTKAAIGVKFLTFNIDQLGEALAKELKFQFDITEAFEVEPGSVADKFLKGWKGYIDSKGGGAVKEAGDAVGGAIGGAGGESFAESFFEKFRIEMQSDEMNQIVNDMVKTMNEGFDKINFDSTVGDSVEKIAGNIGDDNFGLVLNMKKIQDSAVATGGALSVWAPQLEEASRAMSNTQKFAAGLTNEFGQTLLFTRSIEQSIKNIVNSLASRALQAGIFSLFGGGSFLSLFTGGFQHGGQFTVPGAGGPDSRLVAFRATPGEQVTVQTPQQQITNNNSAPITLNIHANNLDRNFVQNELGPMLSKMVEDRRLRLSATNLI